MKKKYLDKDIYISKNKTKNYWWLKVKGRKLKEQKFWWSNFKVDQINQINLGQKTGLK